MPGDTVPGDAAPGFAMLQARARMLSSAREFFAVRAVLEVDTPILGDGLVVESHIDPIPCQVRSGSGRPQPRHLLTSPEGPMKRLLAAGSGPIYQFAHAFRDGEQGRRHATEFTMLEWYRPGFDHHELMAEVEALVQALVPRVAETTFRRRTYREIFIEGASVDPFATSLPELRAACERIGVPMPPNFEQGSLDDALDLLLVSHIEPTLGSPAPTFVHAYPASQAALAQVHTCDQGHAVAQRFELYIDGLELANGYHELADAAEQRRRFEQANRDREASGRDALPIDEPLITSLQNGFPACAGVALGFDRLLMVATGAKHIDDVRCT
ncbi:MAG: lysyl-tRNA synthetase class 2 [Planctomycetota bacterium]|jgi:lysyl-tRNA synthetase class 2